MIKAKLIKLKSISHINDAYIKDGQILEGWFSNWPVIGHSFIFIHSERPITGIETSCVSKIIDDRTFETQNSIYKIVTLEDLRDEKIEIIINGNEKC